MNKYRLITNPLTLLIAVVTLSSCSRDIVRDEPEGRTVTIILNWDTSYLYVEGENIRPDTALINFTSTRYYFYIVDNTGQKDPIVKKELPQYFDEIKEITFRSKSSTVRAAIRMEHGNQVKETRPIEIAIPTGDCTLIFKYSVDEPESVRHEFIAVFENKDGKIYLERK